MRQITLTATTATPLKENLTVIREEPTRISIMGQLTAQLIFTIGETECDDPLIEATGTGEVLLLPELLQVLVEGASYRYNLWMIDGGSQILMAMGQLSIQCSIAPYPVDASTVFLSEFGQVGSPDLMVVMTVAEYDSLPTKDPDTLYILR